jgi:ribosome-binding protein aMBF1 (putative translation factor)
MKKPLIESTETVIVGRQRFEIPKEKARAVLTLVRDAHVDHEWIPADEVFKDLHAKYGRRGAALRGARLKEDLTQVELAKRLGITQGDLSKMESGKRSIGKKMAHRLSKTLNIDYRIFL